MSKEIAEKTEHRKKTLVEQRSEWKAVINGESAENIARFRCQVAKYGRIKTWW